MKKFAARSFMATILVASTLLSLFSAVTSASAATTVSKGIYKPTSIGIGTNINISTPDPGVATYVGRDMYIGGKPSLTKTLDAKNAPTGSYAAEAEGLTVVRGKLAMNPIKKSWGGDGFRFGTVGFGSQFRPSEGSTVLAVAGINSWIENMNTGRGGTSDTATVGAWTRGAWVGRSKENTGCDYTAKIAGPITYGSVRPGLTFRPVIFLRLHNGRPLSNLNPARGDAPETGRVARLALPFHADLPANSPSPRRAPAS